MSRNKKKHPDNIESSPVSAAILEENVIIQSPSIMVWLLSTVLFCLFSSIIAPLFISLDKVTNVPPTDVMHQILGVIGICTYFIVPVYTTIYDLPVEDEKPYKRNRSSGTGSIFNDGQGLISWFINSVLLFIIGGPIMIFSFFKPVFRAFILLTSFSYLGLPGGESRLFVIIVMSDILLYYINMIFPKWGFNPAKIAAVFLRIKQKPLLLKICTVFYIFYTAVIYFFISGIGYYIEPGHHYVTGEREILLLFSWALATIFTRLPFIINGFEGINITGYFKKMPWKNIVFQIIVLAVSFIAYMWRFWFG